jgi:hypothetical protein
MPPSRDLALLRQSAAALRARGDTAAADEVDRAIRRIEAVPTHRADLDSVARGLFRLQDSDEPPKPRPPKRPPLAEGAV